MSALEPLLDEARVRLADYSERARKAFLLGDDWEYASYSGSASITRWVIDELEQLQDATLCMECYRYPADYCGSCAEGLLDA